MRSHELAQLLLSHPDVELVCQKDSEGNGYSPLEGVDFDVIYIEESTYDGRCYATTRSARDNCMTESAWIELKNTQSGKHAVLYPVN